MKHKDKHDCILHKNGIQHGDSFLLVMSKYHLQKNLLIYIRFKISGCLNLKIPLSTWQVYACKFRIVLMVWNLTTSSIIGAVIKVLPETRIDWSTLYLIMLLHKDLPVNKEQVLCSPENVFSAISSKPKLKVKMKDTENLGSTKMTNLVLCRSLDGKQLNQGLLSLAKPKYIAACWVRICMQERPKSIDPVNKLLIWSTEPQAKQDPRYCHPQKKHKFSHKSLHSCHWLYTRMCDQQEVNSSAFSSLKSLYTRTTNSWMLQCRLQKWKT